MHSWTLRIRFDGQFGEKIREIVVGRTAGVWEHTDIWLGVQIGSVLKPNTNAQRMPFLSHVLRSPLYTHVQNCNNFLRSFNMQSRTLLTEKTLNIEHFFDLACSMFTSHDVVTILVTTFTVQLEADCENVDFYCPLWGKREIIASIKCLRAS